MALPPEVSDLDPLHTHMISTTLRRWHIFPPGVSDFGPPSWSTQRQYVNRLSFIDVNDLNFNYKLVIVIIHATYLRQQDITTTSTLFSQDDIV